MTQPAPAHSAWPPTAEPRPVARSAPLVLVIDNSLTVRKIVEITLHRAGFDVHSFADGLTALRWLASPDAAIPVLIYLDIELPGMDGYAVAHLLRARPGLARAKLVMLSRRDGVLDRVKSRLVGACDHLAKPFRTEQLVELTRAALATLPEVTRLKEGQP